MKHTSVCAVVIAAALVMGVSNRSESTPVPAPSQPLPVGHPPIETGTPALPPGHPPIEMSAQSLPPGTTASDVKNPQWTVPADWKTGKTSSIRRGSYTVTGTNGLMADVAITVFPGDVGGLQANVNRWRSQIGLPPATPEQINGLTTTRDCNGLSVTLVDFTGATPPPGRHQPQRMIVATISQGGNSWFIKLTGDAPLVAAQQETFLKFLQSVKF